MPTWLIVVLAAIAALALLLFLAGLLWSRRETARTRADLIARVTAADQALAQAMASDRGWNRDRMEEAARTAFAQAHGGVAPADLHLVLVDDRPGTDEDRAVFEGTVAGTAHTVAIARRGDAWHAG